MSRNMRSEKFEEEFGHAEAKRGLVEIASAWGVSGHMQQAAVAGPDRRCWLSMTSEEARGAVKEKRCETDRDAHGAEILHEISTGNESESTDRSGVSSADGPAGED
jgi:hypothetical protein